MSGPSTETPDATHSAFPRVLAAIECLLDDPSDVGLQAAIASGPEVGDDLLAYLHERFVAARPFEDDGEDDPIWWRMIGLLAHHVWDEGALEQLANDTLFDVAGPDAYRWLAPALQNALEPSWVEKTLLRVLERGTPLQRTNASHLAYHLFGAAESPWALSAIGRARLSALEPVVGA